jgi:hypothetical protein
VFQTGPGEELLCPPQTAPLHLSGFTQHGDGVYFGNSVRLSIFAIAFRASRRNHPRARHVAPGRNATAGS